MRHTANWFDVDKAGLAALRSSQPKSAMVFELAQNTWDTDATYCKIDVKRLDNGEYMIRVEDDDPNGFADLSHAFTLFAKSIKKGDPEKRGRFNLGEKLVLALCARASISTVNGTVCFGPEGREKKRKGTERGTVFEGLLKMSREEAKDLIGDVLKLLPPQRCHTTLNGIELNKTYREVVSKVDCALPTVIGDDLRSSKRKTTVEVWTTDEPERITEQSRDGWIYEMGIPVVETGDRYHYNVLQKVPLTLDRSNVTPAFLKAVRSAVAEAMIDSLTEIDANSEWVRTAAASPDASQEITKRYMDLRFGEKVVIFDPNDMEANSRAVAEGYEVIKGRQLSAQEWANVKRYDLVLPAGRVFPSHPSGIAETLPYKPTSEMLAVEEFCKSLSEALWGRRVNVTFVSAPDARSQAQFWRSDDRPETLQFNVPNLPGKEAFFSKGLRPQVLDLIIHEFGHHYSSNHLSEDYYHALTSIGAKVVFLALSKPDLFCKYIKGDLRV